MNALVLANELEKCWADPGLQLSSAEMIRKQHEAIVKLRKTIEYFLNDKNDEYISSKLWHHARTVLKDTEEVAK